MTWEYLAGLFDGEGSISVNWPTCGDYGKSKKKYPVIRVDITQKNIALLLLVKEFTGMGDVRPQTRASCWHLAKKKDVRKFLELLAPHLILRKTEAEIAIRLCKIGGTSGKRIPIMDVELQTKLIAQMREASNLRRGKGGIVCQ